MQNLGHQGVLGAGFINQSHQPILAVAMYPGGDGYGHGAYALPPQPLGTYHPGGMTGFQSPPPAMSYAQPPISSHDPPHVQYPQMQTVYLGSMRNPNHDGITKPVYGPPGYDFDQRGNVFIEDDDGGKHYWGPYRDDQNRLAIAPEPRRRGECCCM